VAIDRPTTGTITGPPFAISSNKVDMIFLLGLLFPGNDESTGVILSWHEIEVQR